MNIQNRKHMLKWHSWNTNRKLRVLVSMIMIFHETQCLSNWETFPTILKIFSITHVVPHVALFEARSYAIRLFINNDCNYNLFGEKFISFYSIYISISKTTSSEIYNTSKDRMCKKITNHAFLYKIPCSISRPGNNKYFHAIQICNCFPERQKCENCLIWKRTFVEFQIILILT